MYLMELVHQCYKQLILFSWHSVQGQLSCPLFLLLAVIPELELFHPTVVLCRRRGLSQHELL